MADRELKGMVVVITGASSGFGKGCALRFAQEGSAVVLAARRDQLLDKLAQECEAHGSPALPVPTDVSREADVANLANACWASSGASTSG